MENTGRINGYILPEIRDILYDISSEEQLMCELDITTKINKAHVLMLAERECIPRLAAEQLLKSISEMESCRYDDVLQQPMQRGLYFAYESMLIKRIGSEIGGLLQYGRSRNDLKATVLKMQLREPLIKLIEGMLALEELLLEKAREYKAVIMPAYTHYQPAVPITYGHYLLGFGNCLMHCIEHMEQLMNDLDTCPLGAGAVGGTTVPIDSNRTAELLGFVGGVTNSVEAVANRDYVLRILAELSILDCSITRICEDLLLWTSSDFNFIHMPDFMVGGSSMMPNKRNVFVLENIRGRAAASSGAFISAVNAMNGTPFSNSIATGTEGVSFVWSPLSRCTDTLFLLSCVIRYGVPNEKVMRKRAESGYTLATEQANYIVRNTGQSFRDAHGIIGRMITEAENKGKNFVSCFSGWVKHTLGHIPPESITAVCDSFLNEANYGGGPGLSSWARQYDLCRKSLERLTDRLKKKKICFDAADKLLSNTTENFLKRG